MWHHITEYLNLSLVDQVLYFLHRRLLFFISNLSSEKCTVVIPQKLHMLHIGIVLKTVKVVILCLGKYSRLRHNLLPQKQFLEKTENCTISHIILHL